MVIIYELERNKKIVLSSICMILLYMLGIIFDLQVRHWWSSSDMVIRVVV